MVAEASGKRSLDRRRFFQGAAAIAASWIGVDGALPARSETGLYMVVTAAIRWTNGKAQFFLNDGSYVRYDMGADRMDPGYPRPIDDRTWPGMAPYARLIAAACNGPRGKAYLFLSNGRYLRYDIPTDRADAGYPKPIDDKTWPGLGSHATALAAALDWSDNKYQFFLKNGQYIRYDVAADRADDGYPKDITESTWPGVAPYKDKLAGMINWGNGKAYMFLNGGRYIRYDIDADRSDDGYPQPINDRTWPGMGSLFRPR